MCLLSRDQNMGRQWAPSPLGGHGSFYSGGAEYQSVPIHCLGWQFGRHQGCEVTLGGCEVRLSREDVVREDVVSQRGDGMLVCQPHDHLRSLFTFCACPCSLSATFTNVCDGQGTNVPRAFAFDYLPPPMGLRGWFKKHVMTQRFRRTRLVLPFVFRSFKSNAGPCNGFIWGGGIERN